MGERGCLYFVCRLSTVLSAVMPPSDHRKGGEKEEEKEAALVKNEISRNLDQTSDAGSQYRCGRVGRGIQPQSPPPHTNIHKKCL